MEDTVSVFSHGETHDNAVDNNLRANSTQATDGDDVEKY